MNPCKRNNKTAPPPKEAALPNNNNSSNPKNKDEKQQQQMLAALETASFSATSSTTQRNGGGGSSSVVFPTGTVADANSYYDGVASISGGSSHYQRGTRRGRQQPQPPQPGAQEHRVIRRTRWLLLVAYIVSLVTLTVSVYRYVKHEEEANFRDEFEIFAGDAIALTGQNVRNAFQAIELFATSISSHVAHSNSTWPKVVVPDFSAQASHVADIGGADQLVFALVVQEDERLDFEAWMRDNVHAHLQDAIDYLHLNATATELEGIPDVISALNISTGVKVPETRPGPYLVNWHRYPFETPKHRIFVNNNLLALRTNRNAYATVQITRRASLSFAKIITGIRGQIFQPIFDPSNQQIVGVLWVASFWSRYLQNLLPDSARGIVAVLRSSCGFESTFEINGRQATQLALEDLHDPRYDDFEVSGELFTLGDDATTTTNNQQDNVALPANNNLDVCLDELTLHVYPSQAFEDSYLTNAPILYSGMVLIVFVVAMVLFVIYDLAVNRRQLKVTMRLNQQDRIVSNLFPQLIMTRMYEEGYDEANNLILGDEEHEDSNEEVLEDTLSYSEPSSFTKPQQVGEEGTKRDRNSSITRALADLYPEATILQADLVGFTAWSSQRAPPQVFTLLESLFVEFDRIARRYNVFKVESIGDCYIAVTGVPDADPNHAVNMARFARVCLARSMVLTKKLEVKLGPDTGNLNLRIGIHSGQVTAGVLRGERARFQLFGDSVNTAGLLRRNGKGERIQISESTAHLLLQADKDEWIVKRSDTITLSGKGTMQTYWLRPQPMSRKDSFTTSRAPGRRMSSDMSQIEEVDDEFQTGDNGSSRKLPSHPHGDDLSGHSDDELMLLALDENHAGMSKRERLVEWHVETLSQLLEQVIAARGNDTSGSSSTSNTTPTRPRVPSYRRRNSLVTMENNFGQTQTVLEEFQEIITLPKATASDILRRQQNAGMKLPEVAKDQLRHLLSVVSEMYNSNAFHNFEHASHVTASVSKMLARITDTDKVAANDSQQNPQASFSNHNSSVQMTIQDLAGHSYGITSDPLTQFAVVFSAIIHDVDHPGVTNAQLIQEKSFLATRYKQKSVAEQNSVDLVWTLLINPEYTDLRQCIYTTEDELRRFRQLIVNIVMATDICDKELGALRKNRWNLAFSEQASRLVSPEDDVARKATIVLEHLIQASDVCHTMQHWDVYLLWNERYFHECYGAYLAGRAATDPSVGWFQGEIGFFDFYVIPLAKKLKSCGVFGVSSDEYLNYALTNRKLWEENGQDMVAVYLRTYQQRTRNPSVVSLRSSLSTPAPTTGDLIGNNINNKSNNDLEAGIV